MARPRSVVVSATPGRSWKVQGEMTPGSVPPHGCLCDTREKVGRSGFRNAKGFDVVGVVSATARRRQTVATPTRGRW